MQYRRLGKSSLVVSALGLGCMGMSQSYGTPDEAESVATLHHAIDRGITFLDTADVYGAGANEELVGRTIAKRRNEVVVATKFGVQRGPDRKLLKPNGKPEYVQQACEASLRRLGIPAIDLYYQHRVDPDVPIEDVAGAVQQLIRAGKVRYFGLSEAGPETIRRAHAVQPVSALQTEYSIFERDVEEAVLPAVRQFGIGFVPYSPLGRGFLTAAVTSADEYADDDMRRLRDPRWQGDNFEKNRRALTQLEALAADKDIALSQLALAWLLAQGDDVVPIPGTRSITRLEENLGAVDVRLTDDDLRRVREAFPNGAYGARYAEATLPTWV
jgi:aryl-alcohol dehydrogenase-like predicted oxidoreductase